MARTKQEAVKYADVPRDEGGRVSMAFPKRCWAHAPSDDPKTWYLRLYFEPDDALPDGELLMGAVDALKRREVSRSQSRLHANEVPYAKGRLAQAWRSALPNLDIPDVLTTGAITPDETSAESAG